MKKKTTNQVSRLRDSRVLRKKNPNSPMLPVDIEDMLPLMMIMNQDRVLGQVLQYSGYSPSFGARYLLDLQG